MSTKKDIQFEIGQRTYRVITRLDNVYDIYGFKSLSESVGIYTDLDSGDKIFVIWSAIPVIRFIDAPGDESDDEEEDEYEDEDEDDED